MSGGPSLYANIIALAGWLAWDPSPTNGRRRVVLGAPVPVATTTGRAVATFGYIRGGVLSWYILRCGISVIFGTLSVAMR